MRLFYNTKGDRSGAEIPGLTALRGIAALLVCIMHLSGSFPNLGVSSIQIIDRAWLAVEFFVLMSGFIVYHVYADSFVRGGVTVASYADFLISRLARVWPLVVAALLLSISLHVLAGGATIISLVGPRSFVAALETGLLINGFLPGARWNYPSWSITAEMVNYVLAPFLITAVAAVGRRALLMAAAASILPLALTDVVEVLLARDEGRVVLTLGPYWLALQGPARPHLDFVEGLPIVGRCLPIFLLGAVVARLFAQGRLRWLGNDSVAFGATLLILVSLQLTTLSILTMFGFVLLTASAAGGGGDRLLETAALRWLGKTSFGIYMVHAPVQLALHDLLERFSINRTDLGPALAWSLLLAMLGLVLIGAHFAYHYIEQPARAAIRAAWRTKRGSFQSVAAT